MVEVSVIIPTKLGREQYLNKAIQSVLAQTFQDFEIIIIKNYKENRLKINDSRIVEIYEHKKGVSAARNKGMEIARGKYIAFLDDDDIWLPNKLEEQLQVFMKHSDAGLVYGKYRHTRNNKVIPDEILGGHVFNELLKDNFIGTSTVIIKKSVFESIGGFDENLSIGEDWDYWLRISKEYPIYGVNNIVTIYTDRRTIRDFKQYYFGYYVTLLKWWDIMNDDAKNRNLLKLLWYGKMGNVIPVHKYWVYKICFKTKLCGTSYILRKLKMYL